MANRNAKGEVHCSYTGLADHMSHQASTAFIGFLTRVALDADFDGIYLDNQR